MQKLTHNEEAIMQLIWSMKGGFIKDFLSRIEGSKPPYTTLASVVKNLQKKGFVTSEKHGNTFRYIPIIKEAEYKKRFMSDFVNDYFSNSYKELVSFFAVQNKISTEELKEIIQMIEKGEKK